AEQTFTTLVGLELRPRKLREAAALWDRLTQGAGIDARDAVWQHPDLLPSIEDLDDPAAFIDRTIGGDTSGIDEALSDLKAELDRDIRNQEDPGSGPVDN
ncbi:zinc-dependent metalloprotease, partial [Mycobacterium marinum]